MINFIQLSGPFLKKESLIPKIKKLAPNFKYIIRIGIQSQEGHRCEINNEVFEIGVNNLLEFDEVKINSLSFLQNESNSTLVDCVIK